MKGVAHGNHQAAAAVVMAMRMSVAVVMAAMPWLRSVRLAFLDVAVAP